MRTDPLVVRQRMDDLHPVQRLGQRLVAPFAARVRRDRDRLIFSGCGPYGANIQTNCMVLLLNNITGGC